MIKHASLVTFIFLTCANLSACSTTTAAAGSAAYQPIEYKLAAGDDVRISVFGEDRFTNDYQVSTNGDISFPLIGSVCLLYTSPSPRDRG